MVRWRPGTLKPKAIRATYDIDKTDLQRFRGLEPALRADLPRAINDVVDKNVLVGTDFTGSILERTADPTNPSVDVTFGSGIASLAAAIDGKYARTLKEVKLVVNPHTMATMYGAARVATRPSRCRTTTWRTAAA